MGDQGSGIDDALCAEKVVHSMCVGGGRVNDGSQDTPLRSELNIEVTWTVSTSERKSKSKNRLETLSVREHREKTYSPLFLKIMNELTANRLSPNDLHHVILNKRNWSPDLEALLESYAKWDKERDQVFQDYLLEQCDQKESLWNLLRGMGIGIRPVGFEFYVRDQKEEEVQS